MQYRGPQGFKPSPHCSRQVTGKIAVVAPQHTALRCAAPFRAGTRLLRVDGSAAATPVKNKST